jgi:NADPH2:quinone reductase
MPLPETMTAIAIPKPGGPEALKPETRPLPKPGPTEVLVRVAAAGVNRPDVMQRMGMYPPPPGAPDIPGLEIAGEVVALGDKVTRIRIGDKVAALVTGGGYAEYCVADEAIALPVPKGLSMIEAAALPETFFTVWHNMMERGALKAGETVLIHGGDVAIDYKKEDFVATIKAATGGRGVDLIIDIIGGDYVDRNFEAAALEGRIVQVSVQQGTQATVDVRRLMQKRLTHTGSTLRPRPVPEKAAIARGLLAKVWPLIEAGKIKPVIDSTFLLADAPKAHARMESSAHIGKIVLVVRP